MNRILVSVITSISFARLIQKVKSKSMAIGNLVGRYSGFESHRCFMVLNLEDIRYISLYTYMWICIYTPISCVIFIDSGTKHICKIHGFSWLLRIGVQGG